MNYLRNYQIKHFWIHILFLNEYLAIVIESYRVERPLAVSDNCKWTEDRESVQCSVRRFNNDTVNSIDYQRIGSNTKRMLINCDETLMFESYLPVNAFKNIKSLEELYIEDCRLLHITNLSFIGLDNLKTLSIRFSTEYWNQSYKLEIEDGTFGGVLHTIEHLQLKNNIRKLSDNLLCPLSNLKSLDLSDNRLHSISECGIESCEHFSELKSIDLSHNELYKIGVDWIEKFTANKLEILHLNHNNISYIEPTAFNRFPSLIQLNLSNNHLEILPENLFINNNNIQEIILSNNKLYNLPSNIFKQLPHLLVIDLTGNQLSSHYIDSSIFRDLNRLVVLNLSNNAITRIDAGTFIDLHFLQVLNLSNNSIGLIDEHTFEPLNNLHTLNLSGNRLHLIYNGLFTGLHVLSHLILSNNLITVIETMAFHNCTSIKELDLSSNQLNYVPVAVRSLGMLRTLDLGENRITQLYNDSFKNLDKLTGLRLMDNLLTNITIGPLNHLIKLNVLNLARNKIQGVERGSFDFNNVIEAIRLDKNQLTDINGVFAVLKSLLWLNLSENQINWFDYAFIPMNLKWLDIHGNVIEALGNYYNLKLEISVTTLDASHNRITELGPTAVPHSIEFFFINNNQIETIYPNTFIDRMNLTRIDLYSNKISRLSNHALRVAPTLLLKKDLPEIYLGGNPIECDCSMGWLHEINNVIHSRHYYPRIMDYDKIECLVTHQRQHPVQLLADLTSEDFLCHYESQCPGNCHCCEHPSCHCNVKCPNNCSCFHDQIGTINKVYCGKKNAPHIPKQIPVHVTDLYLDGNNFLELINYAFAQQQQLKNLYLNGSNIISFQPHALTGDGLNSLEVLHLEDNKLTTLFGYEFKQLFNLRELYIHNNLLSTIERTTFIPLKFLQKLRLDGNHLTTISTFNQMKHIKLISLSRNSWSCECQFITEFVQLIYKSDVTIQDIGSEGIYCTNEGDATKQTVDLNLSKQCKLNDELSEYPDGIPHGYVPLLVFGLTIMFILFILILIFSIKEHLCCIRLRLSTGKPNQRNYQRFVYDSVILTSERDSELVDRFLIANIHSVKSYLQIGCQYRSITPTHILPASRQSRIICLYLTDEFLRTEWNRIDIRNAVNTSCINQNLIIIEPPNLNTSTGVIDEFVNQIKKEIIWLRTREMDFFIKLANSLDNQYIYSMRDSLQNRENKLDDNNVPLYSSATAESILSITPTNDLTVGKNNCSITCYDEPIVHHRTPSLDHAYTGIDSDYGSVTNEDSIVSVHRTCNTSNPNEQPLFADRPQQDDLMLTQSSNGYFV